MVDLGSDNKNILLIISLLYRKGRHHKKNGKFCLQEVAYLIIILKNICYTVLILTFVTTSPNKVHVTGMNN